MATTKKIVVGITGASGVIYGVRLTQELLKAGHIVHLMVTDAGWKVLQQELDWNKEDQEKIIDKYFRSHGGRLLYHTLADLKAPIASGSYSADGMVVIPCSMGTMAKIAHGISSNLLERAADVMLKERKRLIVVPRETPLNAIQIENMLNLTRAGATILPAMPGFYHKPETIDQIVNHLVGKVLDSLDISHSLFKRWGE